MQDACGADDAKRIRTACVHAIHGTERYGTEHNGTERHDSKTPIEILAFRNARLPVDNPEFIETVRAGALPQRVHTSWVDEWFTDFLTRTAAKCAKRQGLWRLQTNLAGLVPLAEQRRRTYDAETERLTRFLRGQNNLPLDAAHIERTA